MTSNKCPKCGFITLATVKTCKNCGQNLVSNRPRTLAQKTPRNSENEHQGVSYTDSFIQLNFLIVTVVLGTTTIFYVMNRLPDGTYPKIILFPAIIPALIIGIAWAETLKYFLKKGKD